MLKKSFSKIKAWAKKSWAGMVPVIAVALAVYIVPKKFSNLLMILAAWLFVRWVIGIIKKNQNPA